MNTPAPALLCRLLCACEASYGISPSGPFVQHQPYYDKVGFLALPTTVQGGVDNIDAALVGQNGDGIVVAFRGTLAPQLPLSPPEVMDWLQDFQAAPQSTREFPGRVHCGFYTAVMTLWAPILAAVQALRAVTPNAPIYVTGHSKGGALASLGAWLLAQNKLAPTAIATFASPHVGDEAFAEAYNAACSQWRYENYLDLVPFVPPSDLLAAKLAELPQVGHAITGLGSWDYTPVGALQYIQENGQVVGNEFGLDVLRVLAIAGELAETDFSNVASAHSLVGYALGYCRGVCDSGLCTPT